MSLYNYREFATHKEYIKTYLQLWLVRKTNKEAATDLLNKVEKSGIRWLCTISGFTSKPETRDRYTLRLVINLVGAITIFRSLLVLVLPNNYVRIAFGDLFIGTLANGIQNSLICFIIILASGLRYLSSDEDKKGQIEPFKIYNHLRSTKFDHKQSMLTSSDCSHMQKRFCFFSHFYLISSPTISFTFVCWLTFAFISNPINYENLQNALILGFWTIVTSSTLILGTYPAFWVYTKNTLMISYITFALNSNHFFGRLLINSKSQVNQKDLFDYLSRQNMIYNSLKRSNYDLSRGFFFGVVGVSCYSNFSIFVSIFVGTGSKLFDVIIFVIGIITFIAIIIINLLTAIAAGKVTLSQLINYQIARRCKLDIYTSLKILATCERMNSTRIGFSLGGLCTMDSRTFLMYLLENAGLMLMFITNFKKSQ